MSKTSGSFVFLAALLTFVAFPQPNRISQRITAAQRIRLTGSVHPKARAENDQGPVDPDMQLSRVTLVLHPSASQQAALDQLLRDQQDPASPNYHHWLTPEEYADLFGVSQNDINQILAWLKSQNLMVVGVARGRDWIAVSGSAATVEQAFDVPIHHYLVNGETHFANASAPSIPAALQGIVAGIHGLTDFRLKPASRPRGVAPRAMQPQYNANVCGGHCLGPGDVATIYNLAPLLNAGVTGSGEKIAVAGQTQIRLADVEQFRSFFGLPANDPQVVLVPNATDPGIVSGDLSEADLDVEMAGAAAPNATVVYVYSSDVMSSAQYAIDQNLAPVLSISYGDCEAAYSAAEVTQLEALGRRANAQGMTWFAASGDSGATDCVGDTFPGAGSIASVDLPAGLPEVTGIGGTELNESAGNYWNAANGSNNSSALSYIPEIAWNDTAIDQSPSASGGGPSTLFAKPSWQTGAGVPADSVRDVPDISIAASADHDGYLVFTSDPTSCGGGRRGSPTQCEAVYGGTSVGAPLFSGMAALLNQWLVSKGAPSAGGLGNINPLLYGLAQTAPAAFHDVVAGNNIINVTCTPTQRNCTAGPVGYNAGPGYDLVTGLGSVDAGALFNAWLGSAGGQTRPPAAGGAPTISAIGNAASYRAVYAPGMILTIYGTQLASTTTQASTVPLPLQLGGVSVTVNGVPAPLWYVSPIQLNVQVPYETPVNSNVALTVNNNGQTATANFSAALAAPGIFTDSQGGPVPMATGARGQVLTMFVTGAGGVSPGIIDGAAPPAGTPLAALPQPMQNTNVSVGGVNAPIQFAGIPWGLVGVVQINYQIPAGAPLGPQPVVVSVGNLPSNTATLTVTP
ncbi:MAG TPA: protease pro-enzyme activation domain-containing protein [Bryobacteraceae bacterium]|nr:protease pro-enzyme activation domain-containing protein [Bryobacteraceae bacterium]